MSYENAGVRGKSFFKKSICFVLLIATMSSLILISNKSGAPVLAATVKEQENKINSLKNQQDTNKKKQQDIQREIQNIKSKTNNQLELKNAYDEEIRLIQEEIELCEEMVECLKVKIEAQKEEIEQVQAEYERSYEACKQLIVYSYEEENTDYISILLDSKNLEDFLRHIDIINDMMEYTKTTLEKFGDDTRKLKEVKVTNEDAYASQLDYMKKIEEKKETLYIKVEEANRSLQILEKEQKDAEYAASKIKKDENDMQNLIVKLSNDLAAQKKAEAAKAAAAKAAQSKSSGTTKASSGTSYVGGTGGWPVTPSQSPAISSGFGWRVSPITKRQENHLGIDIPAAYGSGVYAFNSGTVILAQSYSSYGNCVVLDHGGGITTLYAHNSSITVKVGDYVTKGNVIAKVGSTGASTGNHCHFEVAVNGVRQNPVNYLK